jgi:hypothetical protein
MLVTQQYYGFQDKGTYTVPAFDGNSEVFPIQLDAGLIKRAGRYIIVKSATALTNYSGATASFVGTSPLRVKRVTPAGSGDVVGIGGTDYYCVVVTVG